MNKEETEQLSILTPMQKYRLFRQFMANELQITRDDIEQWTREAVEREGRKLVGQLPVEQIVLMESRKAIDYALQKFNVKPDLARLLAERLQVSVVPEEKEYPDRPKCPACSTLMDMNIKIARFECNNPVCSYTGKYNHVRPHHI